MVDLKQFQTKTNTSNIVFKKKKVVKSINQKVDSFLFRKNKNCYKSAE